MEDEDNEDLTFLTFIYTENKKMPIVDGKKIRYIWFD